MRSTEKNSISAQSITFVDNHLFMRSPQPQIVVRQADNLLIAVNPAAEALFGYSQAELLQMTTLQLSPERQPNGTATVDRAMELIAQIEQSGKGTFSWWHLRKSGEIFWAEVCAALTEVDGVAVFHSSLTDQTLQHSMEQKAEMIARLTDASLQPFYICRFTEQLPFQYVNLGTTKHFELCGPELLGRSLLEMDINFNQKDTTELITQIRENRFFQFESLHSTASGKRIPVRVTATYYCDEQAREHVYGSIIDIRREKEIEKLQQEASLLNTLYKQSNRRLEDTNALLKIQAHTDRLTGINNREGLFALLGLEQGRYPLSTGAWLLMIDIDHFKSINDTYSHLAGDLFISKLVTTLNPFIEKAGGTFSRLGGEEFLAVVPEISQERAIILSNHLNQAVSMMSIEFEGRTISRTISIGVSKILQYDLFSQALGYADMALGEAKQTGRNRVVLADKYFLELKRAQGYLQDPNEIKQALAKGEFLYYAQPIVDTRTGQIHGYEALIRWEQKNRTLTPQYFLKVFRHEFFKPEFQEMRAALSNALVEKLLPSKPEYISWNFNLEQFESDEFTQSLLESREPPFLQPDVNTVIEISESEMNERRDLRRISYNLQQLRSAGFKIALDDFGIEQSNLYRLVNLPIDIIKVDKSLVDGAQDDRRIQSTIRFISLMAASLGIEVVAEGMEDARTARLLHNAKITYQQGFFHSRPLSPSELSQH